MKKYCLLLGVCLLFFLSISVVWAEYGPCEITLQGGMTNTMNCSLGVCYGSVLIIVTQSSCAGTDPEDTCTNTAANWSISYPAKVEYSGVHIPFTCVGITCVQDLTTPTITSGGNTCF
jgi:hypothetical protein